MALRPKLGPGSGVIPGTTFFEEYQPAMKGLFDASALPLTNIGGTPNDVTADLYWELDAGLIDGMKFTLTWAASNGGPMTLSINGGPQNVPVLDAGGNVLTAGITSAGKRSFIEFIGGAFRILSGSADGGDGEPRYWVFTASGTWEKPVMPDNHMVFVEAWGGGGGGGSGGGGGGGGGYSSLRIRAADLPSVVSISIGAGGAVGGAGGITTFGGLLSADRGTGGESNGGGNGGGPGGADGASGTTGSAVAASDPSYMWGGGGGGHGGSNNATFGATGSVFGGGGGRGAAGSPGLSIFGGDGGASGEPGHAPGGGGARSQPGARGEVRIWA